MLALCTDVGIFCWLPTRVLRFLQDMLVLRWNWEQLKLLWTNTIIGKQTRIIFVSTHRKLSSLVCLDSHHFKLNNLGNRVSDFSTFHATFAYFEFHFMVFYSPIKFSSFQFQSEQLMRKWKSKLIKNFNLELV